MFTVITILISRVPALILVLLCGQSKIHQDIPIQNNRMTTYNISADISSVEVLHQGKPITIQREQNPTATIRAEYAITARKCPPYCIQPLSLAAGVATLGELEVLDYLHRIHRGDRKLMVVDSRTPD